MLGGGDLGGDRDRDRAWDWAGAEPPAGKPPGPATGGTLVPRTGVAEAAAAGAVGPPPNFRISKSRGATFSLLVSSRCTILSTTSFPNRASQVANSFPKRDRKSSDCTLLYARANRVTISLEKRGRYGSLWDLQMESTTYNRGRRSSSSSTLRILSCRAATTSCAYSLDSPATIVSTSICTLSGPHRSSNPSRNLRPTAIPNTL